MEEAEAVATSVSILIGGRMQAADTVSNLKADYCTDYTLTFESSYERAGDECRQLIFERMAVEMDLDGVQMAAVREESKMERVGDTTIITMPAVRRTKNDEQNNFRRFNSNFRKIDFPELFWALNSHCQQCSLKCFFATVFFLV